MFTRKVNRNGMLLVNLLVGWLIGFCSVTVSVSMSMSIHPLLARISLLVSILCFLFFRQISRISFHDVCFFCESTKSTNTCTMHTQL